MKKLVLVVSLLSLLLTCCEKGQAPVPEEQEYVFSIDPPRWTSLRPAAPLW